MENSIRRQEGRAPRRGESDVPSEEGRRRYIAARTAAIAAGSVVRIEGRLQGRLLAVAKAWDPWPTGSGDRRITQLIQI